MESGKETKGQSPLAERLMLDSGVKALVAPAGFGKSRLLKLIAEKAPEFGYLETVYADRWMHEDDPNLAAHHLGQAIARKEPSKSCILIDDVEACDVVSLVATLDKLCSQGESPLVIMAMRQLNVVPFAHLQVAGKIEVFDTPKMRIDERQQKAMLKSVPRSWQQRIARLGNDWPAALALLAAWASGAKGLENEWLDEDILLHSGLAAYIDQQILPTLSEREQQLLGHMSLFEQSNLNILGRLMINIPVDAIVRKLLYSHNGLLRREGKLVAMQPALSCYFLSMFLARNRDETIPTLLVAADESASAQNLPEACKLAAMANMPTRIDQYVEQYGTLRIWVVFGYQVLRSIVESAGQDAIGRFPRLQLMMAIAHLKEGEIKEAEKLYLGLACNPDIEPEQKTDLEVLRVSLMICGCNLEGKGDLDVMNDIIGGNDDDAAWRSTVATLSCISHAQKGQFDKAGTCLAEARRQAQLAHSEYNVMFSHMHEATIFLAQGELLAARTALAVARKMWKEKFFNDEGVDTVISSISSSIEFESGRLTRSRNFLRRSTRRLPHSEAWFDIYVAAYEPMVRLSVIDHGLESALAKLEHHRQEMIEQGLPRVATMLAGLATCLQGQEFVNTSDQNRFIHAKRYRIDSSSTWQEREIYNLANAYIDIAAGNWQQAANNLEDAMLGATKLQLNRSVLRFRLLLSVIYLHDNRTDLAQSHLHAAIAIGARTGQAQIFREMNSDALSEFLADEIRHHPFTDDVIRLFLKKISSKHIKNKDKASGVLTLRELEILSCLAEGGSDKMLGRQLQISEHGVRYHLKNIYRKLAVHDRTSAVSMARESNLV
ncbi:MAG: LuxR C-terminal-related transcriptional regulator [Sphingorhabdus sp.]